MTTRPENGHDDGPDGDKVRNIVSGSNWTAVCSRCPFTISPTDERGPAIDAAQTHVRETGHETTFVAEITWSLSKVDP